MPCVQICAAEAATDPAQATSADFLEIAHVDNSKVTLLVAHAWARTDMPADALKRACTDVFEKTDGLMKNALFAVKIPVGCARPAVTVYKPKKSDMMFRLHITGAKSWADMEFVSLRIGRVAMNRGYSFDVEQPQVDLVNLKFKLDNLRIRSVSAFVRSSAPAWGVPPEELAPGRPVNIRTIDTTILIWATGSVLVMLKRVRRGTLAQAQLDRSRDLLHRLQSACSTIAS